MAIANENLQNTIDRMTAIKERLQRDLAKMSPAQHEQETLTWLNGELSGFSFALNFLQKQLESTQN